MDQQQIDVNSLVDESVAETTTEQSAPSEEAITAEDLRQYLGADAEGMSDEELLAAYEEAKKAAEEPQWDRPWAFVDEAGNKVMDLSKLTGDSLLKLSIAYKADDKEQRRHLDEIIRLAQRTPLYESKINGLLTQLRELENELNELREYRKQAEEREKTWLWALQDQTGERFAKLQQEFLQASPAESKKTEPTIDESELVRQGEYVFRTQYEPTLKEMARQYSLDGNTPTPEVVQHLTSELSRYFLERLGEQAHLIRDPRYREIVIRDILEYDIPMQLEAAGYKRARSAAAMAKAGTNSSDDIQALRAEIEHLKTQLQKARVKSAPSAGAGVPARPTKSLDRLEQAKSLADIKALLEDPTFGQEL